MLGSDETSARSAATKSTLQPTTLLCGADFVLYRNIGGLKDGTDLLGNSNQTECELTAGTGDEKEQL